MCTTAHWYPFADVRIRRRIRRTLWFYPHNPMDPMLRSMHELKSYAIGATDGEIGHVADFFFDDQRWTIRYLVVETGSWLLSRKVLVSPFSLLEADWPSKRLPVCITREQVKVSPDIDSDRPVSRQHEMQMADYYGYPYYWGSTGLWGDGMYLPTMPPPSVTRKATQTQEDDPHLRSCIAVTGYQLHATDGDIGHISGMLVEEANWTIRYLVVNTGNWWPGHEVLVAPNWFSDINWAESSVHVMMSREAIRHSPPFDSTETLNRNQEAALYAHHHREGYWDDEVNKTDKR